MIYANRARTYTVTLHFDAQGPAESHVTAGKQCRNEKILLDGSAGCETRARSVAVVGTKGFLPSRGHLVKRQHRQLKHSEISGLALHLRTEEGETNLRSRLSAADVSLPFTRRPTLSQWEWRRFTDCTGSSSLTWISS